MCRDSERFVVTPVLQQSDDIRVAPGLAAFLRAIMMTRGSRTLTNARPAECVRGLASADAARPRERHL